MPKVASAALWLYKRKATELQGLSHNPGVRLLLFFCYCFCLLQRGGLGK